MDSGQRPQRSWQLGVSVAAQAYLLQSRYVINISSTLWTSSSPKYYNNVISNLCKRYKIKNYYNSRTSSMF